jgi:hypothetical protein
MLKEGGEQNVVGLAPPGVRGQGREQATAEFTLLQGPQAGSQRLVEPRLITDLVDECECAHTVADIGYNGHDGGTLRTELSTASAPSGLICPVLHLMSPVN